MGIIKIRQVPAMLFAVAAALCFIAAIFSPEKSAIKVSIGLMFIAVCVLFALNENKRSA